MQKITDVFPVKNIDLNGRKLTIKSFPFKRLHEVFEALQFSQLVLMLLSGSDTVMQGLGVLLQENGSVFLGYISNVLSISTGLTEEEIDDLNYDLVIELFAEVIQVNSDFFKNYGDRLRPLKAAVDSQQTGATSMPGLSAGGTPPAQ